MQSKYLLHQDSDALLMALGPTHNTKSGENVHLTLVQSTLLGFFCCASRQWRRGNMHLIATPPVLDCLSPLGATSAAERSGEKPPLTKNKEKKHC